jgi:transcriptional regulator with XRE-family HTH domain
MANNVLKQARVAAGLTQEQLADEMGLSSSQISRFESGKRGPRAMEIVWLARRLRVSIDELMEPYVSESDDILETDEINVVKAFRAASPETQRIIKTILKSTKAD